MEMDTLRARAPRFGATRVGGGLAVLAAALAALVAATTPHSVASGVVGLALVAGGLWWPARGAVLAGVLSLLAGAGWAAIAGAPPGATVVATAGALLAWDLGEHAVDLGLAVGPEGRTRSAEVVHAAAGLAVATLGAAGGVLVFRLAPGGRPPLVLMLLLVGAVLVVAGLRA